MNMTSLLTTVSTMAITAVMLKDIPGEHVVLAGGDDSFFLSTGVLNEAKMIAIAASLGYEFKCNICNYGDPAMMGMEFYGMVPYVRESAPRFLFGLKFTRALFKMFVVHDVQRPKIDRFYEKMAGFRLAAPATPLLSTLLASVQLDGKGDGVIGYGQKPTYRTRLPAFDSLVLGNFRAYYGLTDADYSRMVRLMSEVLYGGDLDNVTLRDMFRRDGYTE
jgi:hypothetical protein